MRLFLFQVYNICVTDIAQTVQVLYWHDKPFRTILSILFSHKDDTVVGLLDDKERSLEPTSVQQRLDQCQLIS